MNKELETEYLIQRDLINPEFLKDYISKDKIKAKIEEYKKQVKQMEKDDIGIGFSLGKKWSDLKAQIKILQSLLEE